MARGGFGGVWSAAVERERRWWLRRCNEVGVVVHRCGRQMTRNMMMIRTGTTGVMVMAACDGAWETNAVGACHGGAWRCRMTVKAQVAVLDDKSGVVEPGVH
ncbi:hypothetical protein L1987_58149 [Smallanthus sonchifolius]|uniref:Uncharacterized protein n=1 Tax=Smallanthus sonchifolius TaxID=185202 RepID=A0ACB9DEI8_9ASTR|nr:hypothetical protein L1987_58149 [Smallanthus sonchifolius]